MTRSEPCSKAGNLRYPFRSLSMRLISASGSNYSECGPASTEIFSIKLSLKSAVGYTGTVSLCAAAATRAEAICLAVMCGELHHSSKPEMIDCRRKVACRVIILSKPQSIRKSSSSACCNQGCAALLNVSKAFNCPRYVASRVISLSNPQSIHKSTASACCN